MASGGHNGDVPFATPHDTDRCPCLSGDPYGRCCAPVQRGERVAATAVALMRSRYTAFATGDADWLRASWHATTRPGALHLDPDTRWLRLEIVRTVQGGPFDEHGEVEFRAIARDDGGRFVLHESSRFVREAGVWSYVDGLTMTED